MHGSSSTRWAAWGVLLLGCHRDAPDPTASSPEGSVSDSATGPTDSTDSDTSTPSDTDTDTSGTSAPLWRPAPGISWQWQLTGRIDTSVEAEAYDIDLVEAPAAVIDELHAAGRVVICYFSAGSFEEWRPDADQFPAAAIGEPLEGWPGESWLDTRDPEVRAIMEARLDAAVDKGCDAVEPDNVDGYANRTGFPLDRADQLDYDRFLADAAHARGLSVGLKNTVELVDELVDHFDWALNEECLQYRECGRMQPFLDAGLAVLHTEYVDRPAQADAAAERVCGDPSIEGFSTLIKTWDLDAFLVACP